MAGQLSPEQSDTRALAPSRWPLGTRWNDARAFVRGGLVRLLFRERLLLPLVLLLTLAQGLLYTALLPPWQHYDEPTHFEHAWLIANKAWFPQMGRDEDAVLRREVAASMLAHNFYWNQRQPNLLSDYGEIWIGVSELGHPPAYYMLVALPLRLVRHLDVTTQLYVARGVSLLLFLLTVAVAVGLMRELTSPGHLLRWAVPLALPLIPPFADTMTAVNNDAAGVLVFSLFLWGCVRLIGRGVTGMRVLWVFGAALLAVLTKNTASLALVLAPIALLIALWMRGGWRWRWLGVSVAGGALVLALATLTWGDAAYWYRVSFGPAQSSDTQFETPIAPVGSRALVLEVEPGELPPQLVSPLLSDDVTRLAGKTVTVGGWFWSDQPGVLPLVTLVYGTHSVRTLQGATQPISLTTAPTFAAWTFHLPADTRVLQYMLVADLLPHATHARQVYADGVVLAPGTFPTSPPTFDDASARSGIWGGRRFENAVRNASAEQAWLHLRPWLDQIVGRYLHRSPAQTVAALLDMQRNLPVLVNEVISWMLYAFFGVFAWGHVALQGWAWRVLFPGLALLALAGIVRWGARWFILPPPLRAAIVFLGLAGLLVWTNTLLRPLPLLDAAIFYPVARYGFPCIIPSTLALVGGVWGVASARWRGYAVGLLLVGLVVLNIVVVQTVWLFYRSLPV